MKRFKHFLQLAELLNEEIEKESDFFFKDRPFLEDPSLEPEIIQSHTDEEADERLTNQETIKKLVTEIKKMS